MATHHLTKSPDPARAPFSHVPTGTVSLPVAEIAAAMMHLPGVLDQLRAELLEGLFTLSPAEAAAAMGLGLESFETATLAPGGPQAVQVGKKRRYRLCELRRWLDGLQGTPGGAAAAGMRRGAFTRLTTATTRPVLPSASGYQFAKKG